jgi:translation initiation factor 1A
MLGCCYLEAIFLDDQFEKQIKRICHIRGLLQHRSWIFKNDIVLVSLRDFQDDKADVIHKYCNKCDLFKKEPRLIQESIVEETNQLSNF